MRSSTSSSDAPSGLATALRLIAAGTAPTLVLVLAAFAAAEAYARLSPPRVLPTGIESTVVAEQMARARSLGDVDILTIGDSSALMDVDQRQLRAALGGTRAESLATVGWVGPAGYGQLLDRFRDGGGRASTVLVLMHGATLKVEERTYSETGMEAAVLERSARPDRLLLARERLWQAWSTDAIDFPLPGVYGHVYGGARLLARALHEGAGSLIDPNAPLDGGGLEPFRYALSDAFAKRLPALGAALRRGSWNVVCAVTPIPASMEDDESRRTRQRVVRTLVEALGCRALELPSQLPDRWFATTTHLSVAGRGEYTRQLARTLSAE
jgi:hypothetical protein